MARYKNYFIDLSTKWKREPQGLPMTPDPSKGEKWIPIPRVARTIPWGYDVDPEDPDLLIPNVEQLELLDKAKKYLHQYSLRNVAHWLTENSGRPISAEGLRKRVKQEKFRAREAAVRSYYERLYKKAAEKAQKIDQRVGGRVKRDGEYRETDPSTT